jgi:hypothetical protein
MSVVADVVVALLQGVSIVGGALLFGALVSGLLEWFE